MNKPIKHKSTSTPKVKSLPICLLGIFFMLLVNAGQSQSIQTQVNSTGILDSIRLSQGGLDILINGPIYFPPYPMAKGNPYLYEQNTNGGSVYTGGLTFRDQQLGFDILNQQLIIQNENTNGSRRHIQLSEMLIDSFTINSNTFINTKLIQIPGSLTYMLAVNKGSTRLLIGYEKEFINQYNQVTPQGKFSSTRRYLYLFAQGKITRIKTKKNLLSIFSAHRKEISNYMMKNHVKIKSATPEQLRLLINFCLNQTSD